MRRIDEYLTRKAQRISPAFEKCIVWCDESGPVEQWTLERVGVPAIGLGSNFSTARRVIVQLKLSGEDASKT